VSPIETPRLLLRRWSDDDLDGLRELTRRPEVMRHIGPRVTLTEEQTEREHAAKLAHWREHGFGARAATRRDTNEWIGYAVLQHPRADVVELPPSAVEIGWLLVPSAWGQGYATEAAAALIEEGFRRVGLDRIVARYQPANTASGRIMEKIGMRFEREAVDRFGNSIRVYSIEKPAGARIRTATDADHPQVLAVVEDWWGGRQVAWLAQRLFFEHFAGTSLIAEDDDGLAGFLIGFLSQSRPDEAYIHMVATRPDLRRTGLARELYVRFFELARAAGRNVVSCITAPANEASIAFHRALGFSATVHPDHEGPGVDKVVFRLEL
jgi:RimJ/RimL family protein N-acetyltransferase